jgi:class 3 adenylate cyclase
MNVPKRHFARIARILGANGLTTVVAQTGRHLPDIEPATMVLALTLTVLFVAIRIGRVESITASIVAAIQFGIWFNDPVGTFAFDSVDGWVAVLALLITATVVSQLSLRANQKAREAADRQREAERLYELGQSLSLVTDTGALMATLANQMLPVFGASGAATLSLEPVQIRNAGETSSLDPAALEQTATSRSFVNDVSTLVAIAPLTQGGKPFGSLAIIGSPVSDTALRSISRLVSDTLDRVRISESLARANEELVRQNQEVEHQKLLSETLLLNILPEEVAAELRENGKVNPKYYEDVTILFTDFVGFTVSTEHLAAEDVVLVLHEYFTAFDTICARYGIEKLKTIGDSYMCIAGLPKRTPSHPVDAVMAACEMIHEVQRRDHQDSLVHWKVRIGLHTGPVVAGVVGIDKFAFDIWGDTVNYASRMESSGAPNRVNISERTYARVKDFFECEYRGKVMTKEKREFDMYFVHHPHTRLLAGGGEVPEAFARRYHVYFQKPAPAFPSFFLTSPPA